MLRLRGHQNQATLWDLVVPVDILELPEELAKVDQWLDDDRFFEPYLEKFNQRLGRPSVPVETFYRLIYLRHRHKLSYEALVREVRDSYTWRKFCRIGPHQRVPDSSTLVKLVKKYGPDVLDQLNEELLKKAREKKVLRGKKLRMDTTVVESDIHYPTDAGLLADGIRMITRVVHHLKEAGAKVPPRFRDQTHAVKKQILAIGKVLRRRTGEAQAEVAKATEEILGIARRVVTGAKAIAHQVTESVNDAENAVAKNIGRLAERLRHVADLTGKIVEQTKQVLSGNRRIPDRIVSLADPEARPIKKGKLKSPTEFGFKVLIQETEDRLVTGYEVYKGNPVLIRRQQNPAGMRRVPVVFVETDGFWPGRQREKRKEVRLFVVHEGWVLRRPGSHEYRLVHRREFVAPGKGDPWEAFSRWLESEYDLSETWVVINGDRASWIRQGVEWFPKALYQVDRFHLKRDVRRLLRERPVPLKEAEAAIAENDAQRLLQVLEAALTQEDDPKRRKELRALRADLGTIPESIRDYRVRLSEQGVCVTGLCGIGSAESAVERYSRRTRKVGRGWSDTGLRAMLHVMTAYFQGVLRGVVETVESVLGLEPLKNAPQAARQAAVETVGCGLDAVRHGHLPALQGGRTGTGGLSQLLRSIVNG